MLNECLGWWPAVTAGQTGQLVTTSWPIRHWLVLFFTWTDTNQKAMGRGRERERATHGVGNRQRAQGEREREDGKPNRKGRERERKEKVFLKWKYNRGGGGERGRKQKKRVKCRQNLCLLSLSWLCWNIMNSIAVGSQVMSRWLSFPLKIILAKSREGKKHFVAFHFFVFSEDLSGK